MKNLILTLILILFTMGCACKSQRNQLNSKSINEHGVPVNAKDIKPILLGSKVPAVNVKNLDGKDLTLAEALKGQPTLLIFYRGGWCPYCNTQLGSLKSIESDLKKLGVQILAISPDKPEELKKSIDKNKLNYQLLSDSKIAAAKAFGIAFGVDSETLSKLKGYGIDLNASSGEDHNILPVPSVFAISADGTISNSYVNPDYTQRPSAQFVLTMAKEISQQKKR